MDFIDQLQALSSKIDKQKENIQTEEATKTAFVLPFINALGYNVFNPMEVIPEYTADVGIKKGEKVDYAIMKDEKPIMLFECKWCGTNLNDTIVSQLYRYFSVAEARIAILTNGIIYRFYSDLEEENKMDEKPFLEFNMLDIDEILVSELKKLSKSSFNLENMITTAIDLKYTKEIKHILAEQLKEPSEDFVKFFAYQVYSGKLTQSVRQQFIDITKRALNQFINEQINNRLKSALVSGSDISTDEISQETVETDTEKNIDDKKRGIVTTEEELEGFFIVKAILREVFDVNRIFQRDNKSYFAILVDDNKFKQICRLYFNSANKYIGFLCEDKKWEKFLLENGLDDIYKYADRLKAIVLQYDNKE